MVRFLDSQIVAFVVDAVEGVGQFLDLRLPMLQPKMHRYAFVLTWAQRVVLSHRRDLDYPSASAFESGCATHATIVGSAGFCCKNSLTIQDVVTITSSSLPQNVA